MQFPCTKSVYLRTKTQNVCTRRISSISINIQEIDLMGSHQRGRISFKRENTINRTNNEKVLKKILHSS